MRALIRLVALFALLLAGGSAQASCIGVGCSCNVSTTPLAMGTYNPLVASQVDSAASITVTCVALALGSASYTIGLSSGGASSFAGRRLASGSNQLAYNLYTDNTYTTVWGDGSSGTATVAGSMNLIVQFTNSNTHTVYGRVAAGQRTAVPGANYVDTVTVTITY